MARDWAASAPPQGGWGEKLFRAAINSIQQMSFWPMRVRARLLGLLGHRLSRRTYIAAKVEVQGKGLVTAGTVSFNTGCLIDAVAPVTIADGVRIGCEAMIVTTTHKVGSPDLRAGRTVHRPVRVGRGSWIGARATILPGVSVAPGCIIAAGAVVHRSTKPNGLYAGVPARRVRDLHQ